MGGTREGEKVYTYPSSRATRYGELIQGVDSEGKARFVKVTSDGSVNINGSNGNITIPANIIKDFITHDLDEAALPITYIVKLNNAGSWLLMKMN